MTALQLTAAGMCCAVGYSTAAATAAMRAGMDHFRETEFIGPQGLPLIGAQLYGFDQWGPARMGWMFQRALAECLSKDKLLKPEETCLLLIVPESNRPGANQDWPRQIYTACTVQHRFHASSRIAPLGKAGLIPALVLAQEFLRKQEVRRVLVAGVDSLFTAGAISYYLEQRRLLTVDNNDGFIPGEGAGAIVLARPDERRDALLITGVGLGLESAHILQNEKSNRASGLCAAIREAVADCGRPLAETLFHMSAFGHESYYFREAESAISRSLEHKVPSYPHIMLTSGTGEVGAASGPLMLAYLEAVMQRSDGPGQKGLIHLSADAGERSAAIVEWRKAGKKAI